MEDAIVTACTQILCMDCDFPFTSLTGFDFRLPVYFFVAGIAETFGMMLLFFFTILTLFDHVVLNPFAYKKLC